MRKERKIKEREGSEKEKSVLSVQTVYLTDGEYGGEGGGGSTGSRTDLLWVGQRDGEASAGTGSQISLDSKIDATTRG